MFRADESVQSSPIRSNTRSLGSCSTGPAHCEVVKIKETCLWDNTYSSLKVYACREITGVRHRMNHQLTIVSKKSGTVKGLRENAGNNKGERVQKRGGDAGRRFWLCCTHGAVPGQRRKSALHSAWLWQNRTRQRSQAVSPMTNSSGLCCRRAVSIGTHSLHGAVLTMCLCSGSVCVWDCVWVCVCVFSLRVGKPTTLHQGDSLFMNVLFADQSHGGREKRN